MLSAAGFTSSNDNSVAVGEAGVGRGDGGDDEEDTGPAVARNAVYAMGSDFTDDDFFTCIVFCA